MKPDLPAELEHEFGERSFQPVTVGMSGVGVWRLKKAPSSTANLSKSASETVFLKASPVSSDPDPGMSVRAEAEKLEWMQARGLNVPRVIRFLERDGLEYLVTSALPGVDASTDWFSNEIPHVVDALADALRALHAVPIASCPFDGRLEVKIGQARRRLEQGLVDEGDFDHHRLGRSARDIFSELLERQPESEDLVFCHGDYCVPNVILETSRAGLNAGLVDVGRAGVADRWQDLALMTRSLESDDLNPQFNGSSARFLERYGVKPDPEKIEFYRLLDEFF